MLAFALHIVLYFEVIYCLLFFAAALMLFDCLRIINKNRKRKMYARTLFCPNVICHYMHDYERGGYIILSYCYSMQCQFFEFDCCPIFNVTIE